MIRIFCGDDRIAARRAIAALLGPNYEVIDGPELLPSDLPNIFLGASLLAERRRILIHDFFANKSIADELIKYLKTPHEIILLETKLDQRTTAFKSVKDQIEVRTFSPPKDPNSGRVFDIFRIAKHDGPRAVQILQEIAPTTEPSLFIGLLTSQAIKDYQARQGSREKHALQELAKLDLAIKTTKVDPWLHIASFLLRLSSLS